ncbi:MAG: NAD-dependent epimerase/dehydratase family protein [Candidatus Altiarchaeota archaeon]|nr:NAD-dependent epimerase/dehydratase family protein [Candidatus Altiarchaeota archaeon]
MENVLVTGGAGFIGSHVADLLLEQGYEVSVIDDLSHGFMEYVNPKAAFHKVDICNKSKLGDVFEKEKPSWVVHLAAHIDVRESVKNPVHDARINILGSINLLECCRKHNIKKIVFASTGGAIYGEPEHLPAKENHPEAPLCPYGVSKLAFEKYLGMYYQLYDLEYTSLRYANVYGPRQDPLGEAGVIAIFTQKILGNETPIIYGDGEQTRDFVYVKDVAKANLQALREKTREKTFNIGTGIETTVNEIYGKLRDLAESDIKSVHDKAVKGEVRNISLDCSLAERELGWNPTTNLELGLEETIKWFMDNKTPK